MAKAGDDIKPQRGLTGIRGEDKLRGKGIDDDLSGADERVETPIAAHEADDAEPETTAMLGEQTAQRAAGSVVRRAKNAEAVPPANQNKPGAEPAAAPAAEGAPPAPVADEAAQPGVMQRIGTAVGAAAADVGQGLIESTGAVIMGIRDAFQATLDGIEAGGNWLNENVLNLTLPEGMQVDTTLPNPEAFFGAPESTTGQTIRSIAQWATAFVGAGKVLKGIQVAGTAGMAGKAALQGALADFAGFDGQVADFSNMLQDLGLPKNVVTDYLAIDEDTGELEGRFKRAIEGLGLGAATSAILGIAKNVRDLSKAHRQAVKVAQAADPADDAAAKIVTEGITPQVPVSDFAALGDPTAKGAIVKRRTPQDMIDAAGKSTADLGVPTDVAARGVAKGTHTPEFEINWARIDDIGGVKNALSQMADAFGDDIAAGRGSPRTFGQVKLDAAHKDAWEVLAGRRQGVPLSDAESLAARNLWMSSGAKLQQVAEAAAAAPTEANLFAFRKMLSIHHAIQIEVTAARADAARSLGSWRIVAGNDALRASSIEDALANMGGKDLARDMAAKVIALGKLEGGKGVKALDDFARTAATTDSWQMLRSLWTNALLTNPTTHAANAISNFATIGQSLVERGVAARVGRALGTDGGVEMGEASVNFFGLIQSLKEGFIGMGRTMRTGQTGMWGSKLDPGFPDAFQTDGKTWLGRFANAAGPYLQAPGRALAASDEFFKTIVYRGELNALALRQANQEAAKGVIENTPDAIKNRIAGLLADPSNEMVEQATKQAMYQTFSDAPSKLGKGLLALKGQFPAAHIFIPFVKTPDRIINFALERSPLAPLAKHFRAEIAAGGARAEMALTKMAVGSAVSMAVMDAAMNGMISGKGPADETSMKVLQRTGWQPYSVKIGDRWYSYSRLDPLGMTMAMAADTVEMGVNTDWNEGDARDYEQIATAMTMSIASASMSKTYMSGLSDLFEAFADPRRAGEGFVERLAGSAVPSAVGAAARLVDPNMREVFGMQDALRARIPGLSSALPPRRDVWGRQISTASGFGTAYDALVPIRSKPPELTEPIDTELLRLGMNVADLTPKIEFGGVTMNMQKFPKLNDLFKRMFGNEMKLQTPGGEQLGLKDYLNSVVTGKHEVAEAYKIRTDGEEGTKQKFIRDTATAYRKAAREFLVSAPLDQFPEDVRAEVQTFRRELADKGAGRAAEIGPKPTKIPKPQPVAPTL